MTGDYEVKAVEVLGRSETMLVRQFIFAPGQSTPWHAHSSMRDLALCVTGEITLETRSPSRSLTLKPGERAETAPGAPHRLVNLGTADAQVLLIQDGGAYDFRLDAG